MGLYSLIIKDRLQYNSYLNQREIENINHHTEVLSYIIDNLEDLIEYYNKQDNKFDNNVKCVINDYYHNCCINRLSFQSY